MKIQVDVKGDELVFTVLRRGGKGKLLPGRSVPMSRKEGAAGKDKVADFLEAEGAAKRKQTFLQMQGEI